MKLFTKYIIKYLIVFVVIFLGSLHLNTADAKTTRVPSFDNHFVKSIDKEKVYDMKVNHKATFKENIRCLLYPDKQTIESCGTSSGGILRDAARYIMVGIVFLFFVLIGVRLLTSNPESDKDKIKNALKSLYYIAIGSLLFFGAVWILGTVINFGGIQGTNSVVNSLEGQDSLLYKAIAFLKILIFFIAIIMMTVYGFKIMSASDKAEEAKKHVRGVANVIIALIFTKLIDYIYYIAQSKEFTAKAGDTIISIARILGYIVGAGATIMVFYAGFLLLTDQGKSENMKKARNIFVNVLLVSVVIFIFLLIMYQLFAEFGVTTT